MWNKFKDLDMRLKSEFKNNYGEESTEIGMHLNVQGLMNKDENSFRVLWYKVAEWTEALLMDDFDYSWPSRQAQACERWTCGFLMRVLSKILLWIKLSKNKGNPKFSEFWCLPNDNVSTAKFENSSFTESEIVTFVIMIQTYNSLLNMVNHSL